MKKKVLLILTAVIFGVMTVSVNAETYRDDEYDMESLPIQLLDFNADNLFFEYDMDSGMDLLGSANGTGLVENYLDKDGNPIYKKETLVNTAKLIGKALTNENVQDQYKNSTTYTTLQKKLVNRTEESSNDYIFGRDVAGKKTTFIDNGWTCNGSDVHNDGNSYYTGKGVIWHQAGDGVISNGIDDQLVKEVEVSPNTIYKIKCWKGSTSTEVSVVNKAGQVLATMSDGGFVEASFNTETNTELKLVISDMSTQPSQGEQLKVAALRLSKADEDIEQTPNLLGNEGADCFYNKGWTSTKYPNATKNNGALVDGGVLWKQDGDGVVNLGNTSTIEKVYNTNSSRFKIKYYKEKEGSIAITVKDAKGNVVWQHETGGETTGWHENLEIDNIPAGNDKITVQLTGMGSEARIAAMSITPCHGYKLGNYDETVKKDIKSLDDVATCMDYAYFVTSHLFKEKAGLNQMVNNTYASMVLRKNKDGLYTFDADQKVCYDLENKAIYNDDINGEDRHGFFPLEGLGMNEQTSSENVAGENGFGTRNYHYTLQSSGKFTYTKGANQYFDFAGDDDVYLFINNQLVLDIGGAHANKSGRINLDELAATLGLQSGNSYDFDFFYMERHTADSNLKISTNISVKRKIEDPIYQRVTFVFDQLVDTPKELYIQIYRNSKKYDIPVKYTSGIDKTWDSGELTKLLELDRIGNYEIKLLGDFTNYDVKKTGEIADGKELKFILTDSSKSGDVVEVNKTDKSENKSNHVKTGDDYLLKTTMAALAVSAMLGLVAFKKKDI